MSPRNVLLLASLTLLAGAAVLARGTNVRLPGNHRGYEPEQPIAYSHRLHAGELGIDCQYCHFGAATSRHAGIPPASLCMNCHSQVTAGFDVVLQEREAAEREQREPRTIVSPELRKLYDALALTVDADGLLQPDPERQPHPIEWLRVHNLPDFTYFDHRVHVSRGLACESCHGPVQSMERVRQVESLSMGWCMSCHRDNPAVLGGPPDHHVSTDCSVCHF